MRQFYKFYASKGAEFTDWRKNELIPWGIKYDCQKEAFLISKAGDVRATNGELVHWPGKETKSLVTTQKFTK